MKRAILLLLPLLWISLETLGQTVPQGMHYQAIATDSDGKVLTEEQFMVKVELISAEVGNDIFYTEIHNLTSTSFGLLNLTIGDGIATQGAFDEIPWSSKQVWVRISTKQVDSESYQIISSSRLYSVPYAFYAPIAGQLTDRAENDEIGNTRHSTARGDNKGMNATDWTLVGNYNAQKRNDGNPYIGTTDYNPLTLVTDNVPRLIISADGDINLMTDLNNDGDLNVAQNVTFNTSGGTTVIHGPTTVQNMSPTHLTGILTVDKASTLNNSLTVTNMTATQLTGTLDVDKTLTVDGTTTLNNSLTVANMGATQLTGTLMVDKATTLNNPLTITNMAATQLTGTLDVDKTLTVDGTTTLNNSLTVSNMGATHLTGTLMVDKATTINNSLTVANMAATQLTGSLDADKTLTVDGTTTLNNSLTVSNMGATHLTGTLTAAKLASLKVGLLVTGQGALGPNSDHLAFFDNTEGGNSDGIGLKLSNNNPDKNNNFMTFYRGNGETVAGRIEGYQLNDIQSIPLPTGDEIWGAICLAIADYNPISIIWTEMAFGLNAFSELWNNTTIPTFDIPDIPAFTIPDVPAFTIPDVPAFVIPDVPGLTIPDVPGVTIPDIPSLSVGPYLCANACFCPCGIDITEWECCCEEVCLVPSFTLFSGITLPDFPGISIPDFPGIPIPDFPGISIPDFPGIPIPDFPGLVIPAVPEINLSDAFGEIPDIPTLSDLLIDEGICPEVDLFDYPNGYFARLVSWAFENRIHNLASKDPAILLGAAIAWAVQSAVLDNGVIYGSKGADYAEYMPKMNPSEMFLKGEIVGVHKGKISKKTQEADQILAISSNPLVLGNIPDSELMSIFEKVAFLGQVPVYVKGPVAIGDYITPSGRNDGIGKVIKPGSLTAEAASNILGKAWSEHPGNDLAVINVSIGLRPTEIYEILEKQKVIESDLQDQIQTQELGTEALSNDIDQIKLYLGLTGTINSE